MSPALRSILAQLESGDAARALASVRIALRRTPSDAAAWYLAGRANLALNQIPAAAAAFTQSAAINPAEPLSFGGLAECCLMQDDEAGALRALEQALAHAPRHPDAYKQLAGTLVRIGLGDRAAAVAMRGLEACGDDPSLLLQLVYALNVASVCDEASLASLHRRLAAAATAGIVPRHRHSFSNDPNPDRPLRIAFLSCDYKEHSCAFFLEGLLGAWSATGAQPYLYSTTRTHDRTTERFKLLGIWRDLREPSPEAISQQASADAIDIVIDLVGWTATPHMRLMASRIAPVQCTYLGYPHTTGVHAMDIRIVDHTTDPPGAEAHASESLLRLPRCFLAFTPDDAWPQPATTATLRDASEPIVFGTFNNGMKLSTSWLSACTRILAGVPKSVLAIKAHGLSPQLLRRIRESLGEAGIDADRVRVMPFAASTRDHIAQYADIDIALDTFPYNGTTTTCEALWMGVGVVTLSGNSHRARVGASLLSAVGMSRFVTHSVDAYVSTAISLAQQRDERAELRRSLRSSMAASPLADYAGLARHLYSGLRAAWADWCAQRIAHAGHSNT